MREETVIAFIAARGGSKRFKNKNIFLHDKKPLISYPIEAARKSKIFNNLVVATDSKKIEKISLDLGVTIFNRTKKSASDYAHETLAFKRIFRKFKRKGKEIPSLICMIYPTAILLTKKDLINSYKIIKDNKNIDVVMGVSKYNYSPYKALSYNNRGYLSPIFKNKAQKRLQKTKEMFVSNGTIYWHRTAAFLKEGYSGHYGNKMKGFLMDFDISIDIDKKSDLKKYLNIIVYKYGK